MKRFTIVFTAESLEDIKAIAVYYKKISKSLSPKFKASFFQTIAQIRTNPFACSVRYKQVRYAAIKRFPYAAHYTIDEINKVVIIHAVLAFSRDPDSNWLHNI